VSWKSDEYLLLSNFTERRHIKPPRGSASQIYSELLYLAFEVEEIFLPPLRRLSTDTPQENQAGRATAFPTRPPYPNSHSTTSHNRSTSTLHEVHNNRTKLSIIAAPIITIQMPMSMSNQSHVARRTIAIPPKWLAIHLPTIILRRSAIAVARATWTVLVSQARITCLGTAFSIRRDFCTRS
jgi:hypothetical protein